MAEDKDKKSVEQIGIDSSSEGDDAAPEVSGNNSPSQPSTSSHSNCSDPEAFVPVRQINKFGTDAIIPAPSFSGTNPSPLRAAKRETPSKNSPTSFWDMLLNDVKYQNSEPAVVPKKIILRRNACSTEESPSPEPGPSVRVSPRNGPHVRNLNESFNVAVTAPKPQPEVQSADLPENKPSNGKAPDDSEPSSNSSSSD